MARSNAPELAPGIFTDPELIERIREGTEIQFVNRLGLQILA